MLLHSAPFSSAARAAAPPRRALRVLAAKKGGGKDKKGGGQKKGGGALADLLKKKDAATGGEPQLATPAQVRGRRPVSDPGWRPCVCDPGGSVTVAGGRGHSACCCCCCAWTAVCLQPREEPSCGRVLRRGSAGLPPQPFVIPGPCNPRHAPGTRSSQPTRSTPTLKSTCCCCPSATATGGPTKSEEQGWPWAAQRPLFPPARAARPPS
jgi:hypothetical protein